MPLRLRARTTSVLTTLFALLSFAEESFAVQEPSAPRQPPSTAASTRPPAIFLDCESCFVDYLRAEVTFVDFVRDRTEADVHVLITRAGTGAGGGEYTLQFIGARAFADLTETIRTVTTSSDSEDQVRRQLATALRVGLLRYLSRETLPPGLAVTVRTGAGPDRPGGVDRWNNWVFSLQGSARSPEKSRAASVSWAASSAPTGSRRTGR